MMLDTDCIVLWKPRSYLALLNQISSFLYICFPHCFYFYVYTIIFQITTRIGGCRTFSFCYFRGGFLLVFFLVHYFRVVACLSIYICRFFWVFFYMATCFVSFFVR